MDPTVIHKAIVALVAIMFFAGGTLVAADVSRKAAAIRIASIDMEDASPKEVFDHLREVARERDPDGVGINIIYRLSPAGKHFFENAAISLRLKHVSLAEVVHCVHLMTGLRYRYTRYGLMISDAGALSGTMVTKIYHLKAGVLDTRRTRDQPSNIGTRGNN